MQDKAVIQSRLEVKEELIRYAEQQIVIWTSIKNRLDKEIKELLPLIRGQ